MAKTHQGLTDDGTARGSGLLAAALLAIPVWLAPSGSGEARAEEPIGRCNVLYDLLKGREPGLYQAGAAQARLHFLKGDDEKAGCPGDDSACMTRAYVVAGDPVVITRIAGKFACAAFAAPKGQNTVTSGWLPVAALDRPQAVASTARDWLGQWRADEWHQIKITAARNGGIELDGDAAWGAEDPGRRERGGVNIGKLAATVTPQNGAVAFSLGTNGAVRAHDAGPGDVTCRVRLWQLGPYLAASDNIQCGGHNVTFTGIYRRTAR